MGSPILRCRLRPHMRPGLSYLRRRDITRLHLLGPSFLTASRFRQDLIADLIFTITFPSTRNRSPAGGEWSVAAWTWLGGRRSGYRRTLRDRDLFGYIFTIRMIRMSRRFPTRRSTKTVCTMAKLLMQTRRWGILLAI